MVVKLSTSVAFLVCLFIISTKTIAENLCNIQNINSMKELKENVKVCRNGEKILITYNNFVEPEIIVSKVCNLKYTILFDKKKEIINTRDVSNKILCIFNPTFD